MSRFLLIDPDAHCLRLAAAGDREAQRQLYEQAAGPVFTLVRRVVRGHAAAEDVFQDCMVAVLRNVSAYRGDAPFGAWVRQVALRQCLMHLRSPWQRARRALQSLVDDEGFDIPAAEDGEDPPPLAELIDLERALARLPEVARAIVWMHDAEGLTHDEIAAAFGRTASFSKSQLARAHALLRAQLDQAPSVPVVAAVGITAQGHLP